MASATSAQAVKGSLLGTITDSNDAADAGFRVTATETPTGIALNVTNSPNVTNPNGTCGNQAFGQVKSTIGGERLVRLGARVTF
jgi:hypothetical protein